MSFISSTQFHSDFEQHEYLLRSMNPSMPFLSINRLFLRNDETDLEAWNMVASKTELKMDSIFN